MSSIDWNNWLKRWDKQQTVHNPKREERFSFMFDVLEELFNDNEFTIIDLACGPGSISQRVLERFPHASSIAVDVDPVLLKLGQEALGNYNGRLAWVDANLNDPNWIDKIPIKEVDAQKSTTALHWLPVADLTRLYMDLASIIKIDGVFMNGDRFKFNPKYEKLQEIAESIKNKQELKNKTKDVENWDQWWVEIKKFPEIKDLAIEREKRFSWRDGAWVDPMIDYQIATLEEVGFKEVGTLWQDLDSRILIAIR